MCCVNLAAVKRQFSKTESPDILCVVTINEQAKLTSINQRLSRRSGAMKLEGNTHYIHCLLQMKFILVTHRRPMIPS